MSRRFVAFEVGGTRFGIAVEEVKQIVAHGNVTPVPQAPAFIEGLINLHGDVVPVIAMRERLGVREDAEQRRSRVIVVELAARQYGLHVDDVREIVELEEAGEEGGEEAEDRGEEAAGDRPAGVAVTFVRGEARVGDGRIYLLDLQRLLAVQPSSVTP